MKKFIASVLLLLVSTFSYAATGTVNLNDLPPDMREAVVQQVKQAKPTLITLSTSEKARNEAASWAELIGSAMFEGAKKTNMLVDDFSKTSVGKITVFIVAYKIIGKDMMRLIAGSIVGALAMAFGIALFRRSRVKPSVQEYDYKPYLFGLWLRKVPVKLFHHEHGNWNAEAAAMGIVVPLVGLIFGSLIAFI